MQKGIRNEYQKSGVEQYYRCQGADYRNPHFAQIRQLIVQNENRIDYSAALDFCCGSGEVTQVIRELEYTSTTASDPFTQKAYEQHIDQVCYNWSFEEVIKGKMKGMYSAIICSFAMHLCPEEQLFPLCYQLFQHSPQLVIITPHKRPELEKLEGIELTFKDFTLTDRGKKVFLKNYKSYYRA